MIPLRKNYSISPEDISVLIKSHYAYLMQAFYESQSFFLCSIYKRHKSIETANIILSFARNIHLSIIRQREKDLNFNVSLEQFWKNFHSIDKPYEKIMSIVEITGIPKETVRRKIKNLMDGGFLIKEKKNKGYSLNLYDKDLFYNSVNNETKNLSIFISKIAKSLSAFPKQKESLIEKEIYSQFSFYWYHYLSCQL